MKKIVIVFLLLMLAFGLVGCDGGEDVSQVVEATSIVEFGENSTPFEMQLIVGTFKLDGTDYEVTTDQASELVTLWQAYQSLATSDTAAQVEIDALIKQIRETMTPEQLAMIDSMELEPGDTTSLMEAFGVAMGEGLPGAGGERFQGEEVPEGIPGGGFPEGGFPGGGFRGGRGEADQDFGEGFDPEQMATLEAMREERGGLRNRASLFLIDPLIQYLEGKME